MAASTRSFEDMRGAPVVEREALMAATLALGPVRVNRPHRRTIRADGPRQAWLYTLDSMYEDHNHQCKRAGLPGFPGVCATERPHDLRAHPRGHGGVPCTKDAAA